MSSIEIRQHQPGGNIDDFVNVPRDIYRGDQSWIPPLNFDIRERLHPKKNPFFQHAEVSLFTAWKNGRLVGRCSAQIDHEHLRRYHDDTGFFGFFDTIDDPEVAQALLARAEKWLMERGMKRMRGPLSLSINEEVGTLIDGFDSPPVILMGHARPYQGSLMERAGLQKIKDVYAWRYEVRSVPERALRAWEAVKAMPEVRLRPLDRTNMKSELALAMDVFNDAWSENWGFVQATQAEVAKLAKDLSLILDPDLTLIAEVEGRAVGICIAIPNLNEAIRDLNGRLGPLEIAKLLWRVKVKRPKSARLMLLGIRKELRGTKRYGGLSVAMYVEIAKQGAARGYEWGELGWTLEDNTPVSLAIRAMGGKRYKTYRLFEKLISQ